MQALGGIEKHLKPGGRELADGNDVVGLAREPASTLDSDFQLITGGNLVGGGRQVEPKFGFNECRR